MKKRVVAKAQKARRRNRERAWKELIEVARTGSTAEEKELTTEQLRLRAVKRAKEARDES